MRNRSTSKRVLIVTSSGGAAHLVAAEAIAEQLRNDPAVEIVASRDVLLDWTGPMGRLGAKLWNSAMRSGDTPRMTLAVRLQSLGEFVFYLPILFRALRDFRRLRVDAVFDCQVMGTRALLVAARRLHRTEGRRIRITKVLTEPANDALSQYFAPIRRLPNRLRVELHIRASPPLLENGQSSEQFWLKHCGVTRRQVDENCGFPVRAAFRASPSSDAFHMRLDGMTLLATSTHDRRPADATGWETVPASHRIVTILMGSQGTWQLTFDSVREILKRWNDSRIILFVFARTKEQRESLALLAAKSGSRTRVISMGYVDAGTVAALYARSDATVTRSGGMTSIELLTVGQAPAFICTVGPRNSRFHGLVRHEDGNFRYLEKFHSPGAWIVEPKVLAERLRPFLIGQRRTTHPEYDRGSR